jgi:UDP-N-acetylglucosamine 4,6-dehydratase/5-epimerase
MITYKGKKALITGGTGSWGQEITRQLLKNGIKEVIIFSRNEAAQVAMRNDFDDKRLKFIIGDVRDLRSICDVTEGINYVFHTAALKHVIKCETQPREAVATNITGTQNVIDACIDNKVDICVNISTDKVCYATCFYGKTKAIAEGLIIEANNQTINTDFISIRSGNLFGSSGSVVPTWISQIKKHNYISVTGEKMRRFFITPYDAVKATLRAINMNARGEVFVPKMDSFYISDLAEVLVKIYGNSKTKIKTLPPFDYERNTEWLITPEEAQRAVEDRYFYIIYPSYPLKCCTFPEITDANKVISKGYTMTDAPEPDIKKLWNTVKKAGY